MSLVKKNYARAVMYKTVLDAYDVNSYVDIDIKAKNDKTKVLGTDPTGLPNNSTALTFQVSINSSVKSVSVVGSAAQTLDALVAEITADLGGSSNVAILMADEKKLRIQSGVTGNIQISAVTAGTLIPGVTGNAAQPLQLSFMPPVTGGGAQYRVAATASASNPVDIQKIVDVTHSNGQKMTTSKVDYDRTNGVLTVRDDGSTEFVAGDVIEVLVSNY